MEQEKVKFENAELKVRPIETVYLGGLIKSGWRNDLIPLLEKDNIGYFNPTTESSKQCDLNFGYSDFLLYVVTPLIETCNLDVISELVYNSYNTPHKAIFCIQYSDCGTGYSDEEKDSLFEIGVIVKNSGGMVVYGVDNIARSIKYRGEIIKRLTGYHTVDRTLNQSEKIIANGIVSMFNDGMLAKEQEEREEV